MSWFEEDPELLRAALEIIESWDVDSSVHGVHSTTGGSPTAEETDSANDEHDGEAGSEDGGDDASSSSTLSVVSGRVVTQQKGSTPSTKNRSAPRELKPSTVSSTRHKRREEIIYLRDKVKDMETQLEALHAQKTDGDGADAQAPGASGVDAALAVMWQDIAGRQQKMRQKAELEQAKLRGLLETQMKVARGLIKLMQKARRIKEDEVFPSAKRAKLPVDVSLGVTEEDQLARIETLYTDMDGAFTFAKFNDGTMKFIDIEILDKSDDEVRIEFRDAWSLPFPVDEVMDAMWTYLVKKTDQQKPCESTSVISVDGDTFSTHFTASTAVGSLKGSFDGKAIHKRFKENGERGPAIVSNMFALPHAMAENSLEGMRMHEDNWLRVLPASSVAETNDGRALVVVQTCRRFRLAFDDGISPSSRRNAGMLTDFLLDQLTQEIQFKHETVETLLINSRTSQ